MTYLIAQIFGLLAILFWIFSIQYKEKEKVLKFQIYASLFYAVQFFLLKGYAAFVVDVLACIRLYAFYRDEKHKGYIEKYWLYIFLGLTLLSGVFTYDGIISIIPILTGIFYTVSTWVKNTKFLRIFYIICAILWTGYNLKYYALTAVIGNIIEIVSGIISMVRFDTKRGENGKNREVKEANI